MGKTYFIIDFDSTFVRVEALDKLAEIALSDNPKREAILSEIKEITAKGMNGEIPFDKSLSGRLSLFRANKADIERLVKTLKKNITPSILRNKAFFKKYKDEIYVLSGGFKGYIVPLFKPFGIEENHILANTFVFNKKGEVTGFDKKNSLSRKGGKTRAIKELGLKGEIYIIGDGYTDYEIKKAGLADKFFVFHENIKREAVVGRADYLLPNFDEFLYHLDLPRAYSYPKHRIKVLLLENISQTTVSAFTKEGYTIKSFSKSLPPEELSEEIKEISILGIRSKTQITSQILKNARRLLAIGAFCIGVNQIDLAESTKCGIPVFNAPYSNTRSVVELVLGEIIMLYRKIFDKSQKLHNGIWDKDAKGSFEIRGKKLGIVGYGNIGSQLSVLAEMLGMEVYFYDIADKLAIGNARKCETLKELLVNADVVTIHVDGRRENENLIGEKEFKMMKNGVIFLNLSRGFIVDIKALVTAVKNGRIAGAAVDVFPHEPSGKGDRFTSQLQSLPNVILTPHIGGSTIEAQNNIGLFVSDKIINFLNSGSTNMSVNFPNLQLPQLKRAHRLIHIHKNVPGVLARINNILAANKINIEGQYLKTGEDIGYVITDVNKFYDKKVVNELRGIPETIKFRILY